MFEGIQIRGLHPYLAPDVVGRQVAGPWVLDHHRTSYDGGASEETVLCFRVDDGRIDRLVLLTMT